MKLNEAKILSALCRQSFTDFVRTFWHVVSTEELVWNWHIEKMCKELERIAERVFKGKTRKHNLVCNISPGSTKSTIFSIMFPAWVWTRMVYAQFIGASYSHHLAVDLARKNRDVVKSELYRSLFPEVQIRADQDTKGHFVNTKGGKRYAVGVNGTVQGMHAHFVIIDDPIDPLRAISEAELATANYWIKNTLSGRLVSKAVSVTLLVMQRLAQGDPSALLLERGDERVRHICIPATLEYPVKPKAWEKYYVDGLMDPVRLPQWWLDEEKQNIGEYPFAGQYGQQPVPAGGGMFKTDRISAGPKPLKFKKLVRFWDKAATPERSGAVRGPAYTVGLLMAEDYVDRIWVLDVVRIRTDSFDREHLIERTAHRDSRACEVGVEQEPGSGGKDSALGTVRRLSRKGFRVRVLRASGRKEIRADEFSVAVNGGRVWIPDTFAAAKGEWIGWAKDFIEELKYWPYSTYKDQGDAAGGAFTITVSGLVRAGPLESKTRPKAPPVGRLRRRHPAALLNRRRRVRV